MLATRILRAAAGRKPMIQFKGRRHTPKDVDHSPAAHPAAPDHSLPESFAQYRNRAIQHGPLGGQQQQQDQRQLSGRSQAAPSAPAMQPYGGIGGKSGKQLGSIQPKQGEYFDREELPARFRRRAFTQAEIDEVDSAGASMW